MNAVFLAELAAWASFGWVAWWVAGGGLVGWGAAAIVVASVLGLWAAFAAPKASAPRWAAVLTKVLVFGGAIVALIVGIGAWVPAGILFALVLVSHLGVWRTGGMPQVAPRAPTRIHT